MMYLWRLKRKNYGYDEYEGFIVSAESEVSAHWVVLAEQIEKDSYESLKFQLDTWWNWDGRTDTTPLEITVEGIGLSWSKEPKVEFSSFNAG